MFNTAGMAITMEPLAKRLPGQTLCFQYHFGGIENFSFDNLIRHFAKVSSLHYMICIQIEVI